jgi:hypothetical protein
MESTKRAFSPADSSAFTVHATGQEESSPVVQQDNCCICSEDAKVALVAITLIALIASVVIMPVLPALFTTAFVVLTTTAIYLLAVSVISSKSSASSGRVSESFRAAPRVSVTLSAPAYEPTFSGIAALRQPPYASRPYGHGETLYQPFGGFRPSPDPLPSHQVPRPLVSRANVGSASQSPFQPPRAFAFAGYGQGSGGAAGATRAPVGKP